MNRNDVGKQWGTEGEKKISQIKYHNCVSINLAFFFLSLHPLVCILDMS